MRPASANEEQGRRLIEAGFSDVLVEAASRCTTWILWHVAASGSEREIVNNGTAFFLDAGKGAFGVTAAHVVAGLEQAKLCHSDLICQVGHCLLDPSEFTQRPRAADEASPWRFQPARADTPRGRAASLPVGRRYFSAVRIAAAPPLTLTRWPVSLSVTPSHWKTQ